MRRQTGSIFFVGSPPTPKDDSCPRRQPSDQRTSPVSSSWTRRPGTAGSAHCAEDALAACSNRVRLLTSAATGWMQSDRRTGGKGGPLRRCAGRFGPVGGGVLLGAAKVPDASLNASPVSKPTETGWANEEPPDARFIQMRDDDLKPAGASHIVRPMAHAARPSPISLTA
jgi:hypothetical protein